MNPTPTNHLKPGTAGLTKPIEAPPFAWTKSADEILERLAAYLDRIPGAGH